MNPSSDELPWDALGRWFAGEMSPEEAAELERWVASEPDRAAAVAALREAWTVAGAAGGGWDPAAAVRRVRDAAAADARVIARLGGARRAVRQPSKWAWAGPAMRVAAVAVVVAAGAFFVERASRRAEAPITIAEYRTLRGQRLALRLTDGTQVTLAPGSVLRRSSDYGQRDRRLELDGEAYFVVTHDSARPFTVHTRRLVARDLGTRFSVRAYPDEDATDVVVAEGKVAVEGARDSRNDDATPPDRSGVEPHQRQTAILSAGQLGRMGVSGEITLRSGVELDRHLAWTEGRLVFNDTPLRDVERQLERWYDIDVRLVAPNLRQLRVTGSFGDEPVTQVLDAVARSLDLVVRRTGSGYELSRKPM